MHWAARLIALVMGTKQVPKKAIVLSIVILIVTISAVAIYGALYLKNEGDSIWREVQDPEYMNNSARLATAHLYEKYQRDMSLMPEVPTLATALAERGRPAATFVLSRSRISPSAKEVANAVFIMREMQRLQTFDICRDATLYNQMLNDAIRTGLDDTFRYATRPQSLC